MTDSGRAQQLEPACMEGNVNEHCSCGARADHLPAPGAELVCRDCYRKERPYTVSRAAYEVFGEMMSPGERAKWARILEEQDKELEAQAQVGSQGSMEL